MKSVFESPRQYQVYSSGAIDLDIQLLMEDGSTRGPVNLTGDAATNYTLEALVDSEGSLSSEFDACVGAWVKVNGSAIYWNLGLDRSLASVGGAASASMLTFWEPDVVYALGKSVGANTSALDGILADIAAAFNTADNRIMVQRRGTYKEMTATGTVFGNPCVLMEVNVCTASAGSTIIKDGAGGAVIATINSGTLGSYTFDCYASVGLDVTITGTPNVTFVYGVA